MTEIQLLLEREGIKLVNVVQQCGTELKASGGRHAGLCPFHDDRNPSFFVFPDNFFKCFGCGETGDTVSFVQKYHSCTFAEALQKLGVNYQGPIDDIYKTPRPPAQNKSKQAWSPTSNPAEPPEKWQERATLFVNWAHDRLLENKHRLSWLKNRGITKDTVRRFRLGWNPGKDGKDLWRPRESWGLETIIKENKQKKRLWLPIGLVIPHFQGDQISRIRIRRHKKNEPRYYILPGSAMDCMLSRPGSRAYVVIEAELDAMLCDQEAGEFCGAIALGSSSTKPDAATSCELKQAALILLALDYDTAGEKATKWWLEHFPQSERWPVPEGKDPGEAYQAGVDISAWIRSGLPPGWHVGPSLEKKRKGEAAKKAEAKENTKTGVAVPSAVLELAEILEQHPVSINVTTERTSVRCTQRWARENWDTSKRFSELVFMTDEVMDFLEDHPDELITRENILR